MLQVRGELPPETVPPEPCLVREACQRLAPLPPIPHQMPRARLGRILRRREHPDIPDRRPVAPRLLEGAQRLPAHFHLLLEADLGPLPTPPHPRPVEP